ncbi:MAG TPA: hypothetical protein VF447_12205 [Terriglobales bacterium]
MMKRRQFIVSATFSSCVLALRRFAGAWDGNSRSTSPNDLSFYIAGARFYRVSKTPLLGDCVRLEPTVFDGKPSYRILSRYDEQLGHVPKHVLSSFYGSSVREARLTRVDAYAIPWKRYEVTIRLDANG